MDLDLRGELQIGGVWVDTTGNLLTRQALAHTRGRQDQGSRVDPSTCRPLINNTDGEFSWDNPLSPHYGKFGRNSPFRFSLRAGAPALELPGSSAAVASTPDAAALDIVGDIDVRVDATLRNWTTYAPGSVSTTQLLGKFGFAAATKSWFLGTRSGRVYFEWSADGTNALSASSTVLLPVSASGRMALRATLDVDNGSSGRTITFYTAPSGVAGPWTQLGDPVVQAGVTSIFNSSLPLRVGRATDVAFTQPDGRFHKAEVRSGIGGTIAANPDFTTQAVDAGSFVDSAGLTWTITSPASITNRRTRLSHELAAAPLEWHPSGKHVWIPAQTAGVLRRMRRSGRALESTLRRRIPSGRPLAYWPLEDGRDSSQFYSPIPGVRPLRQGGFDLASDDSLAGSSALPSIKAGATLSGTVPAPPANTTQWHTEFVFFAEEGPPTDRTLLQWTGSGTVKRWQLLLTDVGANTIGYDENDNIVTSSLLNLTVYGSWCRWQVYAVQNGGNVDWSVRFIPIGGDGGEIETSYAGSLGRITGVMGPNAYHAELDGVRIGHLGVFTTADTLIYNNADIAFTGETAGERMQRLIAEEALPLTVTGHIDDQTLVGPQRPDKVLELLEEAADADGGILYEDRERPALRYRDRASMYNQTPALTLDYTTNVAPPLSPTGDDDATENDVTVSRVNGSSGRAMLEEGPLSVQDPPAGVGPYPASVSLNLDSDDQAEPIAYWRLHLGTYEGRRYPQVHVMVHKAPELVDQILAVDVGDKLVIQNPPPWLAPGDIELIVEGYEETFAGPFQWDIVFNCSPAQPWNVGVVEDASRGRIDANPRGSLLAAAVDSDDTQLIVHTPAAGATHLPVPWITSSGPGPNYASDFPIPAVLGGEVVSVSANTPALWDQFARTVAGGWGAPDAGGAWTVTGTAADYSVGSGVGSVAQPSVGIAHLTLTPAPGPDVDLYVDVATSVLASGASLFTGPLLRAVDNNNHYSCRVDFTTAAAVNMTVRKRVAGVETQLGTYTSGLTHVAGTFYRVRVQSAGTTLRAKIWLASTPEPRQWQIEVTDASLTAAANVGSRSFANTGSTAVSPVMRFDNFLIVTPQRMTVTRSVEGIAKGHAAGAEVRVHKPAVVAL
ncbi:hypothetical protein ACIQAC_01235 [Streptomyces sp. NPDC088387]|uniref:hypothetical protein n=1 Tax=Streptomyces sp. NPDC088387 TaxID=3365859 RepID=UPI003829D510